MGLPLRLRIFCLKWARTRERWISSLALISLSYRAKTCLKSKCICLVFLMVAMVSFWHNDLLEHEICPVSRFNDSSNEALIKDIHTRYFVDSIPSYMKRGRGNLISENLVSSFLPLLIYFSWFLNYYWYIYFCICNNYREGEVVNIRLDKITREIVLLPRQLFGFNNCFNVKILLLCNQEMTDSPIPR